MLKVGTWRTDIAVSVVSYSVSLIFAVTHNLFTESFSFDHVWLVAFLAAVLSLPAIFLGASPMSLYLIRKNDNHLLNWIFYFTLIGLGYAAFGYFLILIGHNIDFTFLIIPASTMVGVGSWFFFWKCGRFSEFLRK